MKFNVDEIMNTSPYFDSVEPNVDDKMYVAKFILASNSMNDIDDCVRVMPKYFRDHSKFFCNSYQEYLPESFMKSVLNGNSLVSSFLANNDQNHINIGSNIFAGCFKMIKNLSMSFR